LGAGAVLVLIYIAVSLISANVLTQTRNRQDLTDVRVLGSDAQEWSSKTSDGITLRGWYVPTQSHRRLIILVHGMSACLDETAGLGRDLHRRGYDVLLFDLRGHGESDPARLTMGTKERRDVKAVLAWAQQEGYPPDQIGWVGFSMGAAVLLLEGEGNPEIGAAVLDSPFGDLPKLLNTQLSKHSHLPRFFNPGIIYAAQFAYGVRTDNIKPVKSARLRGERPTLLFHGEADEVVSVQNAVAIAKAIGPACKLVTFPLSGHVEGYHDNRRLYVDLVDEFFQKNLAR
jgi:uncharacterized protein